MIDGLNCLRLVSLIKKIDSFTCNFFKDLITYRVVAVLCWCLDTWVGVECVLFEIDFKIVIKHKCLIIGFLNLENAFLTDGATLHEY